MSFYQAALIGHNVIGVWEAYLMWRRRAAYNNVNLPATFAGLFTDEEFKASQSYGKDHCGYSLIAHAKDFIFSNISLLLAIPAKVYYGVAARTGLTVNTFAHSCLFSVSMDVVSMLIDIPFTYYDTFVVESKHGFNKTTKTEFVKDIVKGFLLRALLLHPLQTAVIRYVVNTFGEAFPMYFFCSASLLLMAFIFIFPTFIQPLFNTFTPLDMECDLHKKISALAEQLKFPLTNVYIVDGSRRSNHSNAYLYGLFKNKRIVIYDTLIEQTKDDDEQLLAVLSHELGHWSHMHTTMMFPLMLTQLLAIAYGAKTVVFNPDMYRQFGYHDMCPLIGFELFSQTVLEPIMTLSGYGLASLTRRFEFQADSFAVSLGYGDQLRRVLLTLARENKSSLTPDPLYSALHDSHPPLAQRIAALDAHAKKTA